MGQSLYAFYFQLWDNGAGDAYLLDVDRETEKLLFGEARRLDFFSGEVVNNEAPSRFQLPKAIVGTGGDASLYKSSPVSLIRVFADDFLEAKAKAIGVLSTNLSKWVSSLGPSMENTLSDTVEQSGKQQDVASGRDMIYLLSGVHNTRFGADSFAFMFHDKSEALSFKVTANIMWREDERDEDEWIEYRVEEYRVTSSGFELVETVFESGCYYASDEIDREAEVSLEQKLGNASERSKNTVGTGTAEMNIEI